MLEGRRIRLREIQPDEVFALADLANDDRNLGDRLRHVLNSPGELYALASQNNLIESDRFVLAVVDRESGELLGSAHVYPAHALYRVPEIALYIYPPDKRQLGFGFEAIALLANFLFYTRPVPKVTIRTNASNTFLVDALTPFGFTVEATMRKACFYAGRYHDYLVLSLYREEWENQKDRPELDGLRAVD